MLTFGRLAKSVICINQGFAKGRFSGNIYFWIHASYLIGIVTQPVLLDGNRDMEWRKITIFWREKWLKSDGSALTHLGHKGGRKLERKHTFFPHRVFSGLRLLLLRLPLLFSRYRLSPTSSRVLVSFPELECHVRGGRWQYFKGLTLVHSAFCPALQLP